VLYFYLQVALLKGKQAAIENVSWENQQYIDEQDNQHHDCRLVFLFSI
jgi:hypothetical protein